MKCLTARCHANGLENLHNDPVSSGLPGESVKQTRTRIYNPVLVYSTVALLLLLAAAALGGIVDSTDGTDDPRWWPGLLFVVLPILLAVRGCTTGIVITETAVLIRGWFRTRRVPREHVLGVKTTKYSGIWLRGAESRVFRMLVIKTNSTELEVPTVAARKAKAKRLAAEAQTALAIRP